MGSTNVQPNIQGGWCTLMMLTCGHCFKHVDSWGLQTTFRKSWKLKHSDKTNFGWLNIVGDEQQLQAKIYKDSFVSQLVSRKVTRVYLHCWNEAVWKRWPSCSWEGVIHVLDLCKCRFPPKKLVAKHLANHNNPTHTQKMSIFAKI